MTGCQDRQVTDQQTSDRTYARIGLYLSSPQHGRENICDVHLLRHAANSKYYTPIFENTAKSLAGPSRAWFTTSNDSGRLIKKLNPGGGSSECGEALVVAVGN